MKKYACAIFILFSGCLPKVTVPVIQDKDLLIKVEECKHEIAPLRFLEEK